MLKLMPVYFITVYTMLQTFRQFVSFRISDVAPVANIISPRLQKRGTVYVVPLKMLFFEVKRGYVNVTLLKTYDVRMK